MNLLEAIHTRRSVRSYAPRRVDEATIRALLQAAVHAPSAMNTQPWGFAVVQDAAQLKRYSDRAKASLAAHEAEHPESGRYRALLANEDFNIFYDAGTLVVIAVLERGPFAEADAWLAAENLMLAACDVGLGSCCIGFAMAVLNEPATKAELRIPEAGVAVAPIILGYPSNPPDAVPRNEPRVLSWAR